MTKDFIYKGSYTREISFPLGGIGTGCIGIAGNGRLIDWEIFNKPNKGSTNGFSGFFIKAEKDNKILSSKVLNGDLLNYYTGTFNKNRNEKNVFGFSAPRDYFAGVPHFKNVEFKGEFPVAALCFEDKEFPGKIILKAFNPLIPLNDKDSSIPAAFFEFEIENITDDALDFTLCMTVGNPYTTEYGVNKYVNIGNYPFITLSSDKIDKDDPDYYEITVSADSQNTSYQEYWYRGKWFDNLSMFWKDLNSPGVFRNRKYETSKLSKRHMDNDNCTLASHIKIKPYSRKKIRFLLSWYCPNFNKYWDKEKSAKWKNYYTTLFEDSKDCAVYCLGNWDRLYKDTNEFKNSLFTTSIPSYVIDAISSNISILKSPTVLRLEDGTLYGWEGCGPDEGSCEGTCSHVWNYVYTLPFLFPELDRSVLNYDFKYNLKPTGETSFRLQLPPGSGFFDFSPCVDGQFGIILRAYRHWKITGDDEWLKQHWGAIKKIIEFAWSKDNTDFWDSNKDGVLEGRQHHTLDMELFGPNSWLTGFYLAALKAGSEMAKYFKEHSKEEEYIDLFEKGKTWIEENLFNGEYFIQNIDLRDFSVINRFKDVNTLVGSFIDSYWDSKKKEIKYQIGEGCIIDQVIAQWHANNIGLGEIFKKDIVKKALGSIYKYNYKKMRDFFNPCRVYSLNDEKGVIICSFPKGSPYFPITYAEETMPGFEYQVASHMIQESLIKEGLSITKSIRNRFDGKKRNPWNEFECGSNYTRSMASYALLHSLAGFEFNTVKKHIGFNPKINKEEFNCFWCLDKGWGIFNIEDKKIELNVKYGEITIKSFSINTLKHSRIKNILIDKKNVEFEKKGNCIFLKAAQKITNKMMINLF